MTKPSVNRSLLRRQLIETKRIFEKTTNTKMSPLWRAPYGEINAELISWAEQLGYAHVGWTSGFDSLDWVSDTDDRLYRSSEEIMDRLLRLAAAPSGRGHGGIVLMPLGVDRPLEEKLSVKLPAIIDGLRELGYELVKVSSYRQDPA